MRTYSENDDGLATSANDIFLNMALLFLLALLALLPHLNPPGADAANDIELKGQMRFILIWPDEIRADVDMWMSSPADPRAVGYSRKTGSVLSLFRDDLGHALDLGGANFEEGETRGLPAGEYIVNAHLFSNRSGTLPIPVTLEVWIKPSREADARRILRRRSELRFIRHEITLVRFRIDDNGKLVTGSVHNRFKPLRDFKQ